MKRRIIGILWIGLLILFISALLTPRWGDTARFSLEDISQLKYVNITAATTTQVTAGTAFLHAVSINSAGDTNSTCTVLDSVTATGATVALIGASTPGTFTYDVLLSTGLTVVTAVGTATPPDVTVSWR